MNIDDAERIALLPIRRGEEQAPKQSGCRDQQSWHSQIRLHRGRDAEKPPRISEPVQAAASARNQG
jgi:hypothetical protein